MRGGVSPGKPAEPSLLPLAAIHEVLVLKSARAWFTTPFARVLARRTPGPRSQNKKKKKKASEGARANQSARRAVIVQNDARELWASRERADR